MTRTRWLLGLVAAGLLWPGPASAQDTTAGTLRLSWNSCLPQRPDTLFTAPGWYRLIISAANLTPGMQADDNYGVDLTLAIVPEDGDVPDAWRYDDAGCQTDAQYVCLHHAFHKTACPPMVGVGPVALTEYRYDPIARACSFRLAKAYDLFSPAVGQRYTLWQVWFGMDFAAPGPGVPGSICGGAEKPVRIRLAQAELYRAIGDVVPLHPTPGDRSYLRWGGEIPVATVPATWGRVKALFR